jgi:hypothetical protein
MEPNTTSCEPDVLESSAPMSIGGVAVSTPHDLATRRSTCRRAVSHAQQSVSRDVEACSSTSREPLPHVGDPMCGGNDGTAQPVRDVEAALVRLGFKRAEARGAVERAMRVVGDTGDLEQLMRAALRECPRPTS